MNREIKIAKEIILAYLSSNINYDSANSVYEINSNNKKILFEHVSALRKIFTTAEGQLKKELESEVTNGIKRGNVCKDKIN